VAVFDGHGGSGAAIYAAKHLVEVIENTTQWKKYAEESKDNIPLLGEVMQQAFLDIDANLRTHQATCPDTSGCTSVVTMITPHHIVCANTGDSRCVLGSNNETRAMSEDHKPYDEGERKRIEAAGGTVQWERVDGNLAVSRALGDFQYKTRPDLPAKDQKVGDDE
jgi:serine/threonine protein phosphatase PrpC